MFMVIFVTSLVTVIILLITSASYLISLICDDADDANPSDNLGLDTHQFSSTPVISPLEIFDQTIKHAQPQMVQDAKDNSTSNEVVSKESTNSGLSVDKNPEMNKNEQPKTDTSAAPSTWDAPIATQKSLLTSQLGQSGSRQLFDDFDPKEIQLGGTALHWCKSRKSLDRLIKLGIPLELVNKRCETALHVAIRRRKLQVLIGLLCSDVNVESRNENGETPLIVACKVNDIFACQLLLVFDAKIDVTDNLGFTARHYSAGICDKHKTQANLPNAAHLILSMLDSMEAKRCPQQSSQNSSDTKATKSVKSSTSACTDGCSYSGTYIGNSYNRWQNYDRESLYKRNMFQDIIQTHKNIKLEQASGRNKSKLEESRLLSIDGGGMRGVIVCQILIELEKYLKKPILSYFDWVGGTSVGAFLSCALCNGTSLRQLRRICFDVKDEVFSGNKPYNSKFIERVLKRTYGSTLRMSDLKDKKIAVTTVIADRDPCQLRFFRSYKSPVQLLEQQGYSADRYNNISVNAIVTRRQSIANHKKQANSTKQYGNKRSSLVSDSSKSGLDVPKQLSKELSASGPSKPATDAKPGAPNLTSLSKDSVASDNDISNQGREPQKDDGLVDCMIDENEQDPLIWQAVRASAAAPFFFKPYGPYLDGGIISNNPTLDLLTEFFNYQQVIRFLRARQAEVRFGGRNSCAPICGSDVENEEKRLSFVLSLGTGRGKVIGKQSIVDFGQVASGFSTVFSPVELLRSIKAARDLFKKLMQQSCHTEDYILDRAQAWCASLGIPYFRINPPLASIFSIDDKRDEQLINALWQTKLYMRAMKDQLQEIGIILDGLQPDEDLDDRGGPSISRDLSDSSESDHVSEDTN